jgi:hypothetical protein
MEEEKLKQFKKTWTIVRVFESLVLITVGILAIVYADPAKSSFSQWILFVLGLFLAIDGVIRVVKFYFEPVTAEAIGQGLISSIFEISFGILMCIEKNSIFEEFKNLIILFFAILLFSAAFMMIMGTSLGIKHNTRKMWVAIVEYMIAGLCITGGVLLIVYKDNNDVKNGIMTAVVVVCGLIIVALGVYSLVTAFMPLKRQVKKVKPEAVAPHDNVVEAEEVKKEPEPAKEEQTSYNSDQIEHKGEVAPSDENKPSDPNLPADQTNQEQEKGKQK